MIDDATIKRVADTCGFIYPDELVEFARAIEQLARQEQREEILNGYDFFKREGKWLADAIRTAGKEK